LKSVNAEQIKTIKPVEVATVYRRQLEPLKKKPEFVQ